MKSIFFIAIVIASLMFQSCATIITGTSTTIHFNSTPPDAKVQIDGVDVGRTPVDVPVKRNLKGRIVEVSKDGYDTKSFPLPQSFNGWVIGNILCGGIIGAAIDCLTGSAVLFDYATYNVELHEKQNIPATP